MLERLTVHREIKMPLWEQYSNGSCSITRTSEVDIPEDTESQEKRDKIVDNLITNLNFWADEQINKRIDQLEIMIKQRGAEGLGHRFYYKDNVAYPSVTSIITPDEPAIPYLQEHGDLGTWFDEYTKNFFFIGEKRIIPFADSGNIQQTSQELIDTFDKWLEKYKDIIRVEKTDVSCLCEEYVYAGTLDLLGEINIGGSWKKAVFDVKKTKKVYGDILEKFSMQLSAYKYTKPELELGVILTPYSEPIIVKDCFGKFLIKRGEYKNRFGK